MRLGEISKWLITKVKPSLYIITVYWAKKMFLIYLVIMLTAAVMKFLINPKFQKLIEIHVFEI